MRLKLKKIKFELTPQYTPPGINTLIMAQSQHLICLNIFQDKLCYILINK